MLEAIGRPRRDRAEPSIDKIGACLQPQPFDQATPEAHHRKLASQIEQWRPIVEKAGIQAE